MKILLFGIDNKDYSRNRVISRGLAENGCELIECLTKRRGILKYLDLIYKYLKIRKNFDFMMVPFPGHEVMFFARLLTRKKIVFDAFTSHYEGYVLDRKLTEPNSLAAKYYRFIDKTSCRKADVILLDTDAHIDFFVKEFELPREKFLRIWVGTDSSVFYPYPDNISRPFHVHFHGNFIPLQGVDIIIEAARILKDKGVTFQIIGRGQTYKANRELADRYNLTNIEFIERVGYDELPAMMAKAHVCLGIFGDSSKAGSVIPNKIFEAIACARPVITADTPAIHELFKNGENILLCNRVDSEDLADKILYLRDNSDLMQTIAKGGEELFRKKLMEKYVVTPIINNYGSRVLQK